MVKRIGVIVLLAGCSPRFVTREPKRIASVELVATTGSLFCANSDVVVPARVEIHYTDGTSEADVSTRSHELAWTTNIGTVDARGAIWLPPDRLAWLDQSITLEVEVARDPTRARSLTFTPRYDCGRLDATGDPGGVGRTAAVALTYVDLSRDRHWILARIGIDDRPPRYYVIDPGTGAPGSRTRPVGRFVVDARGGSGEDGATGSTGASGPSGSNGTSGTSGSGCGDDGGDGRDGGDGGTGGDGGDGGDGGNGGDGGHVVVAYDARFPELVKLIGYAVDGGAGGAGGPGGRGGPGGKGGTGGSGGRPGTSWGTDCKKSASAGNKGRDGADGNDGRDGADGEPGSPGQRGDVHAQAVDLKSLFADELGRGTPIDQSMSNP